MLLFVAILLMRSDEAFLNGLGAAIAIGAIVLYLRYVFAHIAARRNRITPRG